MADFKTHLIGAALVSGVAAAGLAMTQTVTHQAGLNYFTLGVVGGLLPDIDSENSVPIRIAYRLLSTLVALFMVLSFSDRYSLAELVVLGLGSYAVVRYGFFSVFNRFTVHRGLVHSLPAAALAALLTTVAMTALFDATPLHAWLCGAFLLTGFTVHLTLDEMYSIDLLGRRVKRSFGTAISLGSANNLIGTGLLYAAVVMVYFASPPPDSFLRLLLDENTYAQVRDRLWPGGRWFVGLFN